MTQTEACKTEIEILQNSSGQASTRIVELQKLLHFTEHADMLQAFEEELFIDMQTASSFTVEKKPALN